MMKLLRDYAPWLIAATILAVTLAAFAGKR